MERQHRTAEKVILAGQMNRFLRTDVKCCCATGKMLSPESAVTAAMQSLQSDIYGPYFYESHAKVQTDKRDFI